MNNVQLVGRLTKDPDVRYTAQTQTCVARFNLAVDGPKDKDGNSKADFPSIIVWGKLAEIVEKYLHKGDRVGITGRIQTGSYKDKDGRTIYTTDVVAGTIEFLSSKSDKAEKTDSKPAENAAAFDDNPFAGLSSGDDIPF